MLYVPKDLLLWYISSHIGSMKISGPHELNLCDVEDFCSVLLCIHIGCMEMFALHELILYDFLDLFSVLLCIHIGYIGMFALYGQIF